MTYDIPHTHTHKKIKKYTYTYTRAYIHILIHMFMWYVLSMWCVFKKMKKIKGENLKFVPKIVCNIIKEWKI